MTVKELRGLLENQNDNDLVVMSSDREGNSFSTLSVKMPQQGIFSYHKYFQCSWCRYM